MTEGIVFINGLLVAFTIAFCAIIYFLDKERTVKQKSLTSELEETLKVVSDSHNLLTTSQIQFDTKLEDLRQELIGIENKNQIARQAQSFVPRGNSRI